MATCVTWKQPDANHFNGFCTNKFRLTTPPYDVRVDNGCDLCVVPFRPATASCCCPSPKLTHQRMLYLHVEYTGSEPNLACYLESAIGDFVLLFDGCSVQSVERMKSVVLFTNTCTEELDRPMWKTARSGSVGCYESGGKNWVTPLALSLWHDTKGTGGGGVVTHTLYHLGPFGLFSIPACADEGVGAGIWDISNHTILPDFNLTLSVYPP